MYLELEDEILMDDKVPFINRTMLAKYKVFKKRIDVEYCNKILNQARPKPCKGSDHSCLRLHRKPRFRDLNFYRTIQNQCI